MFPSIIQLMLYQIVEDLQAALYASKVVSYAQGIAMIRAASDANGWDINLADCVMLWRGGCIIRAGLLSKIHKAFTADPDLANLMIDPNFAEELNRKQFAWRRIATLTIACGLGASALTSSLNYFDTYRRENLPANLTQAQRDFFGGHTYQRVDAEGSHHCQWTEAHKSIGDVSERTAGNV